MFSYLLSVTFSWLFFALLYSLFLRRETFFHANRAYLLSAVVLGLALPLLHQFVPAYAMASGVFQETLPVVQVGLQQVEQTTSQWIGGGAYVGWIYLAGLALAAARMIWGLYRLARMVFRNTSERLPDAGRLIRTNEAQLPFSFFNWIFVPHDFADDADEQKMLAHERAHVRGWHSVDVLLMEVLSVVFWFHPLVHWYRQSLRAVHEYLADQEASHQSSLKQYGLLLLRQAQPQYALAFANHFFRAPLKQRLLMLTKNHSPMARRWKYSLVLPAIVLSLVFSSVELQYAPQGQTEKKNEPGTTLQEKPVYPGGMPALMKYLTSNIRYPEKSRRDNIEGMVMINFVVDPSGSVTKVQAAQGQVQPPSEYREEMIKEAIRVIKDMPDWSPAQKDNEAIPCQLSFPIHFKLE